jgi:SAM-dependent methyltransferase
MNTETIWPYGRSFDEYLLMFGLTESHRKVRILGVGDGVANFNAHATRLGWRVVSVDPMYQLSPHELQARVDDVLPEAVDMIGTLPDHWTWTRYENPQALLEARRRIVKDFMEDWRRGAAGGRYLAAGLPNLPFMDGAFDLIVCSHLLFSWSNVMGLDLDFHRRAIREMLRVAAEVRICPTSKSPTGEQSDFLDTICRDIADAGGIARLEWMGVGRRNSTTERLVAHANTTRRSSFEGPSVRSVGIPARDEPGVIGPAQFGFRQRRRRRAPAIHAGVLPPRFR